MARVFFLFHLSSTTFLLASPKSLLWLWWIIDQRPFNSPSHAHSHLLLNGSRSDTNRQRWDRDFNLKLVEECLQSPRRTAASPWTQPSSQVSHRDYLFPTLHPGIQSSTSAERVTKGTTTCKIMQENETKLENLQGWPLVRDFVFSRFSFFISVEIKKLESIIRPVPKTTNKIRLS